jgi:hypothetical protein
VPDLLARRLQNHRINEISNEMIDYFNIEFRIKIILKTQLRTAHHIEHLLRMPQTPKRKKTHVRGVLLDFVLVGVLSGDLSPPEAVLAQVVVVALLAPVPEPAEVVPLARVAHHRVRH